MSSIYVTEVTVIDPDTGGEVVVEIWKDSVSGGMMGVDASYLEYNDGLMYDPFRGEEQLLDVEVWSALPYCNLATNTV